MAHIFNKEGLNFEYKESPVKEFAWHKSEKLHEFVNSKQVIFDVKSLDAGKYSYPYHFHRNAEEIFVILSGKVMLRTPKGFRELKTGDIIFFEMGSDGAHQLYNHTETPCTYLDLRINPELDICEYPDSGKINILPYKEIFYEKDKVDYFAGEDTVKSKWDNYQEYQF